MTQIHIRLPGGMWAYDSERPLGKPGGFGAVFLGTGESGDRVAVKKLHLGAQEAAHRELRIAEELFGRALTNVLPVLDAGQDAETEGYFLVMPVAESSLQDCLDANGEFNEFDALVILSQIVNGLLEVPEFIHRDLKPANVLLLNSAWRIADFGIARFVEESTSARTLKGCLSPYYAAPEQWQAETASHATDVYAIGCIAYVLLTGHPPFVGKVEDIRSHHLYSPSPTTAGGSPQFNSLIAMAMRKAPGARPTLERLREILSRLKASSTGTADASIGRLATAAALHEQQSSLDEAASQRLKSAREARAALALEARATLRQLGSRLAERIVSGVPSARVTEDVGALIVRVGSATIEMDFGTTVALIPPDGFPRSNWDVVCGASMEVVQGSPTHKRAANLWYTKQHNPRGAYRWYEVGYEGNPLTQKGFDFEPAAVSTELADRAHWNGMAVVQVSCGPYPIDDEDAEEFIQRWTRILAEAVSGSLQHLPKRMTKSGL